ncbi:MAG: cytosine permease [Deltaproteobacteria bacterium]|nr:cytosine permease [Deltaproteobacteria bacterium]
MAYLPVFARAAYGSSAPTSAALRAIVACGWFGIQCWIGGKALHTFMQAMWPAWSTLLGGHVGGFAPTQWLSFGLFWGLNVFVIFRGMELVRKLEDWAAPFVLVMTAAFVWWAIDRAHGLGPILAQNSYFHGRGSFASVFIPSLTAMIGFWATLAQHARLHPLGARSANQFVGRSWRFTTMTLFAAMGVLITSASQVIYGVQIWDPMDLAARFESRAMVAVGMFTVVVATLAVNIAANVVSPANDFANAFPKWITFRRGGFITGLVGIAMCPWKLLADPSGYIFAGCYSPAAWGHRRRAHRRLLVPEAPRSRPGRPLPPRRALAATATASAPTGSPWAPPPWAARSPGRGPSSRPCTPSTTTPGSSGPSWPRGPTSPG